MARGYPDFYSFSVIPTLSPLTVVNPAFAVPALNTVYVLTCTNRGIIQGGWIQITLGLVVTGSITFLYYIDNQLISSGRLNDFETFKMWNEFTELVSIAEYDMVNGRVTLELKREAMYAVDLRIGFTNLDPVNGFTGAAQLYYSDII